jgi:hypothetical protein
MAEDEVTKIEKCGELCNDLLLTDAIPNDINMVHLMGTRTSAQWLIDGLNTKDERWQTAGRGHAIQSVCMWAN